VDKLTQSCPEKLGLGHFQQQPQLPVAPGDCSIEVQSGCRLMHFLHEKPVRPVRAFQGINAVSPALLHDHGVNGTASNGRERLFGFLEAEAQLVVLPLQNFQVARHLIVDAHRLSNVPTSSSFTFCECPDREALALSW
jgi:hypothetical protein